MRLYAFAPYLPSEQRLRLKHGRLRTTIIALRLETSWTFCCCAIFSFLPLPGFEHRFRALACGRCWHLPS